MVSGMNLNFDFTSLSNEYLFSPFLEKKVREYDLVNKLKSLNLKSHIFILSSGTTGTTRLKGYALSKESILTNAKSVNEHLCLDENDHWLASLPHYHIGGLSIYARAYLSGAKVSSYDFSWNVSDFYKSLETVTVTSVVPTQCYDLVKAQLPAPKNLRYLIVGGDYLNKSLYLDLVKFGWPVIRTYGMTEVCSQLATEKTINNKTLSLEPLSIHTLKVENNGKLLIKSPSLFTGVFTVNSSDFNYNATEDEFYSTNDLVEIKNGFVYPKGRADNEIKIKGRRVDLNEINRKLNLLFYENDLTTCAQYIIKDDVRDGSVIEIHHTDIINDKTKEKIQLALKPISIKAFKKVEKLNITELGKKRSRP